MSGRVVALSFLMLLMQQPVHTAEKRFCKNNPRIVGQCFTAHGRLHFYNGTPSWRIWWIGKDRLLGVMQSEEKDNPEEPWVPQGLGDKMDPGVSIFGDFQVCPVTNQKPGEMQTVCVESVSNVVIIDYRPESKGGKLIIRKLDGRITD